ncbi:PTS sugar transporter subunit IIC [Enterococcus sp.]|uniref:PTS sugar transporter subunit IIC n=1 Tax=Enterococcus sp. TaxID=35783 RepID=UPI002FC9935A
MSNNSERIAKVQRHLTPLSQKIENQRYLSSVKKGMMDLNIVLLIGSIFTMALYLSQVNWFGTNILKESTDFLQMMSWITYGLLGIYLAISISYHHSKRINAPLFFSIFLSVIAVVTSHLALTDTILFGEIKVNNLFITLLISLLTVELVGKITNKKDRLLLSWIPIGSRKTSYQIFFSISYLITLTFLFGGYNFYINQSNFGGLLIQIIGGFDTPIIIFIIVFLEMLLWFIGLNGYSILAAIVLPIATNNLILNVNLIQQGQEATHIFTPNFWDFFIGMSGSGLVGSLAVLALFSRVKSIKEKGRIAIIPSIFHISEPILYGLPIAYNPYFFIPFVIGSPVLAVVQWMIFKYGFVNLPSYHVADLPLPLAQVLSTMDWRAVLLVIFIFVLSILMYYPFFKMYEKKVIETELINSKDDRFSDLDLDF